MGRISLAVALTLACAPAALLAAPLEVPAQVSGVTLFGQGAQVTRKILVPEGTTGEVLVPNLPDGTDPASLRVAGAGVQIGAVTLIDEREPASDEVTSPEVQKARDAVESLEAALAVKEDALAAIRAKATAAAARGEFLRGLDTTNTAPDQVVTLAQTVAEGVLAAEQERINAAAEARVADLALKPDREALEQARKALAALEHPAKGSDALMMTVAGGGTVTITTFVENAGWAPSYDIRLASEGGKLALDRYVSVYQASGEDWRGVVLTLSTARPSERTAPSELWPDYRRIVPREDIEEEGQMGGYAPAVMEYAPDAKAAPIVAAGMSMAMQGETVTYTYPTAVDIRDGVENLRLKLDELSRDVTVLAEAVPMRDETAYRVAEGRNTGDEPLLPGPAVLWLDGAVVGATDLPLIAAGDKLRLGFGAIDGLRLKRIIPQANEGDRGIISKSNERVELAEITAENLTERDWPMRVLDRVPYTDMEDLQISHTASPAETARDYDDRRGLLAWEFDLGAGQSQTIQLETTMTWPADQVLE